VNPPPAFVYSLPSVFIKSWTWLAFWEVSHLWDKNILVTARN
jgi:hypothetical protein